MQLTAFAFPSDPFALSLVPHPPAMEKVKPRTSLRRTVAPIQLSDAIGCCLQKLVITGRAFRWRNQPNPIRAQNRDRRPDLRGSALPYARSAHRARFASSISVGTTTIVRNSPGTPSRSSERRKRLRVQIIVMARLMIATARSDAGARPRTAKRTRSHPPTPNSARAINGNAR